MRRPGPNRPDEVAAALRGLGYSSAQAARLAEEPVREVTRIAAIPFRAPGRPKPVRLPYAKRRRETADDGRRIFHGYRVDLLARSGGRWTAGRKAAVIDAVRAGTMTREDVQAQHGIAAEEWSAWLTAYEQGGLRALKIDSLKARHRENGPAAFRTSTSHYHVTEDHDDRR